MLTGLYEPLPKRGQSTASTPVARIRRNSTALLFLDASGVSSLKGVHVGFLKSRYVDAAGNVVYKRSASVDRSTVSSCSSRVRWNRSGLHPLGTTMGGSLTTPFRLESEEIDVYAMMRDPISNAGDQSESAG